MNPWYYLAICFLLTAILAAAFIVLLAVLIAKAARKKPWKRAAVCSGASFLLLTAWVLFAGSHSTCMKYNDWGIVGSCVEDVENFYGAFDVGEYREGESGRVGYYIYTDNGPIMPDHLKHYYYIDYDSSGVVCNVCDECQKGG